jgi:murein DD-endopeptidase MepM/ murein hydrolase activator NlpD
MYQRVWIASLLMISVGCSQRAPYRVVANPAPARPSRASGQGLPTLSATAAAATDAAALAHVALYFPVPAVATARLDDSFDAPRGGGRRHHAIDILAPRGTPVVSVEDGRVLRMTRNSNGGISLYATNVDEQFVYYYAHLDAYHATMYTGRPLLRGDTIGYVGTTGNAPKDTPHLHFQMMRMPANRRFWNGEPINPYPFLRPSSTTSTDR